MRATAVLVGVERDASELFVSLSLEVNMHRVFSIYKLGV
jgi:hypothetical protein